MRNLRTEVKGEPCPSLLVPETSVYSNDQELIDDFLARVAGRNQEDVARQVKGVTQDDVSRWRRGAWKRLTEKKRQALLDWMEANTLERGRFRTVGQQEAAADAPQLHDFEAAIRSFAGKNPDMSETERRARLRIAINAQIEARGALGEPIPGWLYELKSEVEDGRL